MDPLNPANSTDVQQEETITLEIPRSTFDMARQFVKAFGQSLDAADATARAQVKSAKAQEALGAAVDPLAGFGEELSQMSSMP